MIGELEAAFGAPVIEAYGMTEAAHQMASNPLPPAPRKPGSVGLAAGPEIAIMDERRQLLPPARPARSSSAATTSPRGYENNPKANAEAFVNGWFRTGDQGVIDADGYRHLTGRLKEIINRGGEKISPREVDEVLMDHPAVLQVVTFAMPHDMLGEDVAAAVVLREGASATEQELRAFVAERSPSSRCRARAVPGRDPEGRHRQAAAHRTGAEARPRLAPTAPHPPPYEHRDSARSAAEHCHPQIISAIISAYRIATLSSYELPQRSSRAWRRCNAPRSEPRGPGRHRQRRAEAP